MAPPQHTYGPSCQLAWDVRPPVHASGDSPPDVKAQFFYQSAFPIDDPLSPVPPPLSTTASAATKHPIRPFAPHDNVALEEAWQRLGTKICGEKGWEGLEPGGAEGNALRRGIDSGTTVEKRGRDRVGLQGHLEGEALPEIRRLATLRRNDGHAKEHKKKRPFDSMGDREGYITAARTGFSRTDYVEEAVVEENNAEANRPATAVAFDVHSSSKITPSPDSQSSSVISAMSYPPSRVGLSNKTTTGTPFLRAPPRRRRSLSPGPETDGNVDRPESEPHGGQSVSGATSIRRDYGSDGYESFNKSEVTDPKASSLDNPPGERKNESIEVPVGISCLHVVELPALEMKPIYWSPVNDISSVTRGTWFYKDTMFPVEAEVANRLEIGYLELKVWTETWNDELNSAISVGAEGEAKVVHRIWPKEEPKKAPGVDGAETGQETRAARGSVVLTRTEDRLVRSTGSQQPSDGLSHVAAEGHHDSVKGKGRRYANSGVIYKNEREAFILRPGLLPSAYYGRRPLAKIRRGFVVGIPIVRGFDWKTWDKIHPTKKTALSVRAEEGAEASQSGAANVRRGSRGCPGCLAVERQQKVTDLVLVIHGIGQKLSQRIESYSFTHLVNSLRRQIHVELGNPIVKTLLRPGHGGIMTLPINWRALLSFDDSNIPDTSQAGKKHTWANDFGLKEITPETIPSVRNLISDVMLDIPYYLSHHKSEMVEAVTREANRVYRLWCKNNPGFEKTGRVHLIAHSLGSVMALDILSKQPTRLPENIDLMGSTINTHRFDFDTKSLFFCGSPAGFFLLLNKASLLPRKGRNKPGADGEDAGRRVAGEANTYGCLAIDNIYNVLNHYDPIAYRLNATVDTTYAASLKPALLPSATTSILTSLTALLGTSSGPSSQNRPPINQLQSSMELETHNFTREEIAEKRMYLLNDNGQIDYFLPTGGGPLDIQYLNILSAHSSYWTSRDFVRFLVVEIGRPQGREHTLANMRAVKLGRKN